MLGMEKLTCWFVMSSNQVITFLQGAACACGFSQKRGVIGSMSTAVILATKLNASVLSVMSLSTKRYVAAFNCKCAKVQLTTQCGALGCL